MSIKNRERRNVSQVRLRSTTGMIHMFGRLESIRIFFIKQSAS